MTIEGFEQVQALRTEDVDGDGVQDLLLLSGREVRIWRGSKDGAIAAAPTWVFTVPPAASFVDVGRPQVVGNSRTPTLFAAGGSQAYRLAPGKPPVIEEGIDVDIAWSDAGRAVFCDLVRGSHLLLPSSRGWTWTPDWIGARSNRIEVLRPPRRKTAAPGAFLEDRAVVTESWPEPMLDAGAGPTRSENRIWMLCPDGIHVSIPGGDGKVLDRVTSTDFLPTDGSWTRRLVDFDGDGVPDLVQESTTNQEGKYAFYRTPHEGGVVGGGGATALKPARAFLHLGGFQLPPDYVDVDGDGRKDFVLTTIAIDQPNLMRALLQHQVTAKTKAFLNRSRTDAASWFAATPDGERASDIGVTLLFKYTGVIDVQRFFTILATADLDGDGRKDLAIRTAQDALTVWSGTAAGVWAAEGRRIAIPAMGESRNLEAYAADLTGDGRDDLILVYRAPPGGADRTVVLVSP